MPFQRTKHNITFKVSQTSHTRPSFHYVNANLVRHRRNKVETGKDVMPSLWSWLTWVNIEHVKKKQWLVGWLVVLGFNATLTTKVISWRSVTHVCFLAFSHQCYHKFSFQSHKLLFSHASAKVRGENTPERSRLNRGSNSQPPGHESNTLTTEPPERGKM